MITLYKTSTCPKCYVLKQKMDEKHIKYEECLDMNKMETLGIQSVPVLDVDGKFLSFPEAIAWVNGVE